MYIEMCDDSFENGAPSGSEVELIQSAAKSPLPLRLAQWKYS